MLGRYDPWNGSLVLPPRFWIAAALCSLCASVLIGGCDQRSEAQNSPPAKPRVAAEDPPKAESKQDPRPQVEPEVTAQPTPKISPTQNNLPPGLENVRMGMSLKAFRGMRDTDKMEINASDESEIPDIDGDETDEEVMAEIRRTNKVSKKVNSANWPGTSGQYNLDEKFEDGPIKAVTYSFTDGSLEEVIVYYDTHDIAQAVAEALLGDPNKDEHWILSQKGENPKLVALVYKDQYVLLHILDDAHEKPDPEGEAKPADPVKTESPLAFNIGPLHAGSFSPVATLSFDTKHRGKLKVTVSGEDADKLVAAWKKIAKQDVVHFKGHKDGQLARISARRGESGYPRAAAEALSREAGQFASPL